MAIQSPDRSAPTGRMSLGDNEAPAHLPVYSKATILGLLMFAVGGLVLLAAAVMADEPGFMVFAGIFTVTPLVLAVLIARFSGWPLVVTALLMLPALAMVAPFAIESPGHPDSFFDFVPAVFCGVGAVIALVAAIVAFVQRRRKRSRATATSGERLAARAIVAGAVALAVLSGALTIAGRTDVSAEARANAIPVTMAKTKFLPATLELRGPDATLVVENDDPGAHSFTIRALDIDVTINGSSEKLVQLRGLAPGTYEYVCRLFGHESTMKGTLTVAQ